MNLSYTNLRNAASVARRTLPKDVAVLAYRGTESSEHEELIQCSFNYNSCEMFLRRSDVPNRFA